MKRLLVGTAVIMIFAITGFGSSTLAQESPSTTVPKVVLTEYSDFQCPSCQYFYPIVKKLKEDFGDQLKVEYKHFPLNSHQYSALAARAAEAAGEQGKFKEMHDLLFENQTRWSYSGNPQALFEQYAKELELDIEQFKSDLNSAGMQKIVMEEKKEGQAKGVNATPTFFVNGSKLENNPRTYQEFKALIESFIKEGS